MANILASLQTRREKTPVLPIEIKKGSSLQGESVDSVDKLIIKTNKSLRKEGGQLHIDGDSFDIETMNVLDLVLFLLSKDIEVSFVNDEEYWNFPALCILDFSNVDTKEVRITHTPFNVHPYNQIRTLSITPLDETVYTVLNVYNPIQGIVPFKHLGNLIHIGKTFQNNSVVILEVRSNNFLVKLDHKFTSSKTETVARFLGGLND